MRINHNIASLNTYRQLTTNTANGSKSLEKLSSGLRINRAGDDAAGLAISEKMRGQIRGLDQASRNAQDGISLIQTAEGALNETHSILQRMRELAVQAATDTNTSGDRTKIQSEMDQLAKEITRISNTTEFNTKNLLAGNLSSTFHIGANKGQNVDLAIQAMDAFSLGVASSLNSGGLTTTNVAGLTSATNFGEGLVAGNYSVIVTNKAAAGVTSVADEDSSGATATLSGTYTGRADVATGYYRFEILTTDTDDRALTGQYSTDNGATWTAVTATGGTDQRQFNVGNGLTLTFDDHDVAANQSFTWGATALKATVQLADAAGTATIGNAVNVAYGDISAAIGNFDTDETVTVGFNLTTLANSAASATQIEVTTVGSAAATFYGDGSINEKATAVAGISVKTQARADKAIEVINNALELVSAERSKLGAMQNRLEHTIANLGTSSENLTASESRIRDVDMAKEMMEFTKNNILQQAAQAMLAQANTQPQGILQLLR